MRRVVVTGVGIVSSIGADETEVLTSLQNGSPGISFDEKMSELGFRSRVSGKPKVNTAELKKVIDRKYSRYMADANVWSYEAMVQAINSSGLVEDDYRENPLTGLIVGSGGSSIESIVKSVDSLREKLSTRRIGSFEVPKTMSSTGSATLAIPFGIQGVNYSPSAACATSTICIGNAYEQIKWGNQDIIFAGGCEELTPYLSCTFDSMQAMSSNFNDNPEVASRPYDANRDGFVIAGGAAILVLEEFERAKARGANIYAEIIGFGQTSDGTDMTAPSGEGAERCMFRALDTTLMSKPVTYVNAHGTSTPAGDIVELEAIENTVGLQNGLLISSNKGQTGHSLGAAGAQESIHTLLMMKHGFVAGNQNIESLDSAIGCDLSQALPVGGAIDKKIDCALSNNFGFGGVNASLLFQKV